jgi:hypothetical protein
MQHPAYFLPRPPLDLTSTKRAAFARLYAETVRSGHGWAVNYDLDAPKWQFLSWLCDTQDILLHGSGNPSIEEFEPRKSDDLHEFGNRQAVYAASDGIWPIYFAIVDRDRVVRSLVNACSRVLGPDGTRSDPYYYFSIDEDALPHQPWRVGTIHLLPRAGFTQQLSASYRGMEVEIAQWASPTPARPLARMSVGPADFPFLNQIRGHDMAVVKQRADRDQSSFPWLEYV